MHAMKTLRVCCQKLFYPNLSTTPSTQPSTSDSDRRKTIALTILLLLATGSQADPAATEPTKPRKFTFDKTPNSALTTDLATQISNPLCLEFLALLNGMGDKGLFNVDGTLVRETKYIKSVKWETIDKKDYMDGLLAQKTGLKGQALEAANERIESEAWVLQRTSAHPYIYNDSPIALHSVWLYRLINGKKYTERRVYTKNGLAKIWPEYHPIQWFSTETNSWFGGANAQPLISTYSIMPSGTVEWIIYKGNQYSVALLDYGDHKTTHPKAELLEISKIILNNNKIGLARQACGLNNELKQEANRPRFAQ